MKKIIITVAILLSFAVPAHSALDLLGQGTSTHGTYNLIYDTDLDVTWYDYSAGNDLFSWSDSVNWADGLSVGFGSNTYAEWRLPTTVDGLSVWGYDGTTTAGYNITSSEMGHLFYTELGNVGIYDTSGIGTNCELTIECLTNTSHFQNLRPNGYWSGTEYDVDTTQAWRFLPASGYQGNRDNLGGYYALAVMSGKAIVPEPASMILFLSGGATMIGRYWRKRK